MSDHVPGTPDRDWDDEPALLEELGRALGHDPGAVPPPDRVAAIRAAAEARHGAGTAITPLASRSPRRLFLAGGIAAGVGGVAGYLGRRAIEPEPVALPPAAPTEQITFTGDAEVSTSALVNHTWGTELLFDVRGLADGTTYDVLYDTTSGEVAAGSLLAVADVVMKCRFSAAPLRADVRAIRGARPRWRGRPAGRPPVDTCLLTRHDGRHERSRGSTRTDPYGSPQASR